MYGVQIIHWSISFSFGLKEKTSIVNCENYGKLGRLLSDQNHFPPHVQSGLQEGQKQAHPVFHKRVVTTNGTWVLQEQKSMFYGYEVALQSMQAQPVMIPIYAVRLSHDIE